MHINNITIPTSMDSRGGYVFNPPRILGYNGLRQPILQQGSTLIWTYDELDDTEWSWWVTTLLNGNRSAEFGAAQLYNDNRALANFTHCIVYKPVREKFLKGKHANVTITIADIY